MCCSSQPSGFKHRFVKTVSREISGREIPWQSSQTISSATSHTCRVSEPRSSSSFTTSSRSYKAASCNALPLTVWHTPTHTYNNTQHTHHIGLLLGSLTQHRTYSGNIVHLYNYSSLFIIITGGLVVSALDQRPRGRGFESAGCRLSRSNHGPVALCTLGLGLLQCWVWYF